MHNLKWAIAGGAFLALATQTNAADLRMPTKAAELSSQNQVLSWTGFYGGVHLGWGWAHDDITAFIRTTGAFFTTSEFDQNGIIGGGQVGYNWQFAPNWLVGGEVDFAGANVTGSQDITRAPGTAHLEGTINYFGTARGRFGYVMSNWLLYGTGGYAWAHVRGSNVQTACFVVSCTLGATDTLTQNRNGWTAGAGVEYAFARNWSVKLEYLHVDFGTYHTVLNAVNRADNDVLAMDTVRAGLNYHF